MKKPLILIIMDGFGLRSSDMGNAIHAAKTPNLDRIFSENPTTQLGASGLDVGLPDGQMGNSEVGHTNIGAGRVVYQELTRISKAIKDGDFFENEAFLGAINNCKEHDSKLHIYGLMSPGGVHSHMEHIFGLMAGDQLKKGYDFGTRSTFADIGATVTDLITEGRKKTPIGESMRELILKED